MYKLFVNPHKFFEEIREQKLVDTVFWYVFGVTIMASLFALAIFLFKAFSIRTLVYYVFMLLLSAILVSFSFILSFYTHFILGKYSLEKSFKVVVYSFYPFYLLSWSVVLGSFFAACLMSVAMILTFLFLISSIEKLFEVSRVEASVCATAFLLTILITYLSVLIF